MPLTEFFLHPLILSDLKGKTSTEVFEETVQFLVDKQLLPPDLRKNTLDALIAREQKLSTGIGEGLALPHASIPGLPGSVVILARSKEGIPYAAPDHQPVHVFFVILVPSHDYGAHLRTLAHVGKFLSRPGMKQKLKDVQEHAELQKLFKEAL
ncbi:MAG: PTS sugar transporter subunit IIA [Blastochloris sp.]|nr:PTS sugar transporter subunit IIA [Blastochloris sp.]